MRKLACSCRSFARGKRCCFRKSCLQEPGPSLMKGAPMRTKLVAGAALATVMVVGGWTATADAQVIGRVYPVYRPYVYPVYRAPVYPVYPAPVYYVQPVYRPYYGYGYAYRPVVAPVPPLAAYQALAYHQAALRVCQAQLYQAQLNRASLYPQWYGPIPLGGGGGGGGACDGGAGGGE